MNFDNEFLGFKVLYKLGQGAFSNTYLAEQEDHRIAIKVIKIPNSTTSRNMSPEMLLGKEFQLNLRKTSTVLNGILKNLVDSRERKGILRYYDYQMHLDKKTGIYSLAILTEHLDSLNTYAQKRDLSVRNILKMGMDLCDGLEYLGRKGVFHGNIKESNIFYDSVKGFKLGDFFFNDALVNTLTPDENYKDYSCRFLAPEAYDDKNLSHQTDIFTLGMLMYKLLNNSYLPYENNSNLNHKDIRERFLNERIIPESPQIDKEIYKFLLNATSFHKGDRFLTFHQMKDSLKNLIATLPYNTLSKKVNFKPTSISETPDLPPPRSNLEKEHPDLVEDQKKEEALKEMLTDGTPFEIIMDESKTPPETYRVGENERDFLQKNEDSFVPNIKDLSVHSYFDEESMKEIAEEGTFKSKLTTALVIVFIVILGVILYLVSPNIIELIKKLFE